MIPKLRTQSFQHNQFDAVITKKVETKFEKFSAHAEVLTSKQCLLIRSCVASRIFSVISAPLPSARQPGAASHQIMTPHPIRCSDWTTCGPYQRLTSRGGWRWGWGWT